MDAKKVLVNGEPLDVILRHYYAVGELIREVKRLNGNFTGWDTERSLGNYGHSNNVTIVIK